MEKTKLDMRILTEIKRKKRTKKEVYDLLYSLVLEKEESFEKEDLIKTLAFFFQHPKRKGNIEDKVLSMIRKRGKTGRCESNKQFIVESGLAYCTDLRSILRWKTDLEDGFYCTKTYLPQQKIERAIPLDSIKQVLCDKIGTHLCVEDFKEKIINQEIFYFHPLFEHREDFTMNLFPKEVFDLIKEIDQNSRQWDSKCSFDKEKSIIHIRNSNYMFTIAATLHTYELYTD